MKNLLYSICLLLNIYSNAQIAITELYYDTPFSETAEQNDRHHAGEYIELFNFTTEDINIGGWYLSDEEGSFQFPQNTVIPSDGLILIAYLPTDVVSYIPNFFPTTQGKETQIIYQNRMQLNNYKEEVSLYMTSIRGIVLPRHQKIQTHKINLPLPYDHTLYSINPFDPDVNTQGYDYYKKSLQIQNQQGFQQNISVTQPGQFTSSIYRTATPLALDFTYQLVPLETVESVIDAILNNYDHFIGNYGVLDLLNNVCDKYVALISQNVITHPVASEKCPEYDAAGNFIGLLAVCPDDKQGKNEEEVTELIAQEDFSSKVWVAPNPTRATSTIFWEKDIEDLIAEIIVVPVNGGQHIPVKYSNINASADVNLSTYPSGIYVVRFTFTSGQVVTKSLIKI